MHKNASTHCHPGSNKIMNNNIIQKNPHPIQDPNLPNDIRNIAHSGLGQTSGFGYFQSEQDYFGDFEQKFLDANLDKVISLRELRAIAEAIGHRDWGYVKYILTIICLMLKSYQNISENCEGEVLNNNQAFGSASDMKGMINSLNDMAMKNKTPQETGGRELYVPQNQSTHLRKSINLQNQPELGRSTNPTNFPANPKVSGGKEFSEKEIKKQLASLETIFTKMKGINVQMNISSCWACQNSMCRLHNFPSTGYGNFPGAQNGRSFFNN